MKISYYSGTSEILKELGRRIKKERIDMNITQGKMADMTGLSRKTVCNLENGSDVSLRTLIEVLRVLGHLDGFDMLVPEPTVRPSDIVFHGKSRERASSSASKTSSAMEWKWGDER